MTPLNLKKLVTKVLDDHKAENITSINVTKTTSIADYMVICSATSMRHIKALSVHLISTCKEQGVRNLGAEGVDGQHDWALIDLGDVIVHIMLPAARECYDLEQLWKVTKLPAAPRTPAAKPRATSKTPRTPPAAKIKKPRAPSSAAKIKKPRVIKKK